MKDSVRAKRRFNVFDAIIIIFIVLCIVAVWFKYYYNNKINSDFVNVEVTFISPSVLQSTADAMKAGKVVYLSNGDKEAGVISSVSVNQSEIYVDEGNGKYVRSAHPFLYDINGKLTLHGLWSEDGFMFNDNTLLRISDNFILFHDIEFVGNSYKYFVRK